ncbi:hypothetical protein APC62_09885 [Acinetobacter pittii]|uniref:hypothetical protein n=1 Tax=Acinetobacter pittii TaxID=48296 RepID=UPI0007106641|nr:hypothetical protein [Acinetobacter pittii]KRI61205.1 hypothetical protein APC62_09885 [Acinetobacter pittii]
MNKNFIYKVTLKKKQSNDGGIYGLLNNFLQTEEYFLWADIDILDLELSEISENNFSESKEQSNSKKYKFSAFNLCTKARSGFRPIDLVWVCDNDEVNNLSTVYFSDSTDGMFIKKSNSKGIVLTRVLGNESFTTEILVD